MLDLLDQPEVIDGCADTGWIDRVRSEGRLVTHRHSAIALAAAAIEAYQDEEEVSRQRLFTTAHGGRPQVRHETGRPLDLKLRGVAYRVAVSRVSRRCFRIGLSAGGDVHRVDVQMERFDEHRGQMLVNGNRFRLVTATHGPIHTIEVDGVTHRVSRDEGGVVRSPAPALVVATPLTVGDEVEAGAPILVLESMKMENVLRAPFKARVRECPVAVGSQVETGTPLMRLEPLADTTTEETTTSAEVVEIDLPAAPARAAAEQVLDDLRALLLGYDVAPGEIGRCPARATGAPAGTDLPPTTFSIFANLAELARNKPRRTRDAEPAAPCTPRASSSTATCRASTPNGPASPPGSMARLERVLAPLRRRPAGPHTGTGGRRLPDLPGPATHGRRDAGRLRGAAPTARRARPAWRPA